MITFPNCKINLGLTILNKRNDGYHNLESVFFPIALHDALEIIDHPKDAVSFTSTGLSININAEQNLVYKAWQLLKNDFPKMDSCFIHLHKNIPMGAGLGGGSADGAFTLVLLNKKFNLGLNESALLQYASELGSDCPFFIINQPCFVSGRGEILERIHVDLSGYVIVMVHPGIHIATAWAFSRIEPGQPGSSLKSIIQKPVNIWKDELHNDFEKPVFEHYPEIKWIRDELYEKGAVYASMSGSGSSVYGIFKSSEIPVFNFPSPYFIKTIV